MPRHIQLLLIIMLLLIILSLLVSQTQLRMLGVGFWWRDLLKSDRIAAHAELETDSVWLIEDSIWQKSVNRLGVTGWELLAVSTSPVPYDWIPRVRRTSLNGTAKSPLRGSGAMSDVKLHAF